MLVIQIVVSPVAVFPLVAGLLAINGVVSWDGFWRTYLILVNWRWGLCRLVRRICSYALFLCLYVAKLESVWEGGSLFVVWALVSSHITLCVPEHCCYFTLRGSVVGREGGEGRWVS